MLQIRTVSPADEAACVALDPSFVTDHVWQMEHRNDGAEVLAQFRTVHLPRLLKLEPPWPVESAFRHRKVEDFFVLAEEGMQLRGYLYVRHEAAQGLGWIDQLVVAGPSRRQGKGTFFLDEGRRWAKNKGLRGIIVPVQTRNYPAIRFVQKAGLRYCGYHDRYFPKDVAVFFQGDL